MIDPKFLIKIYNKINTVMENQNQDNPKEEIKLRADKAIRNHVAWSMGAGLIPIPIADFFAVSAVQLDMIRQLCRLYSIPFKETEGKAIISSLVGSGLSRLGAQAAVKLIPGIGSTIGGVAMSVLSGASTFALGQVFKTHFETGGTIIDFDTERFKKYYEEQFNKGRDFARDVQKEHKEQQKTTESGVQAQKEKVKEQQTVKTETNNPKEEVVIIDEGSNTKLPKD
jgi:uncharacterized protein (DUF697 family)